MPAPTRSIQDAASAIAQAIGAILRAMLDAVFGDISGLAPRHPIVRAHARAVRHIERYVAALAIALATPAAAASDDAPLTPAPRPDSVLPLSRPAERAPVLTRPLSSPHHALLRRQQSRAPPQYTLRSTSFSRAHFVPIS